jgi:hypothetical protein
MNYLTDHTELQGKQGASIVTGNFFRFPFDDDWVLYQPMTDTLLVLNPSGKMVWEMLSEGYGQQEIASAFVQHFGIPWEQALQDVAQVVVALKSSRTQAERAAATAVALAPRFVSSPRTTQLPPRECGTFRFGESRLRIISAVAEFDSSFFSRFRHRACEKHEGVDVLEISEDGSGCRLTFRGELIEEATSTVRINCLLVQLLLNLEHPRTALLAYCHAAAVGRNGQSLLMPGSSGMGKSTLTAFLVANGFSYLGDDITAIGEEDSALLPLPSCLSIKSGAWTVLDRFYPVLQQLPTLNRYGRSLRYVEPEKNYPTMAKAVPPAAIVFPSHRASEPTQLIALPPLQTMIRLVGVHTTLFAPATEEKLATLVRFVKQTPAYELTYSELSGAKQAIDDLLAHRR